MFQNNTENENRKTSRFSVSPNMARFTAEQYARWDRMLASLASKKAQEFESDSESLPDPELETEVEVHSIVIRSI